MRFQFQFELEFKLESSWLRFGFLLAWSWHRLKVAVGRPSFNGRSSTVDQVVHGARTKVPLAAVGDGVGVEVGLGFGFVVIN